MKISYAITVNNEYEELRKVYKTLKQSIRPEDEIVIQQDSRGSVKGLPDSKVKAYCQELESLGKIVYTTFDLNGHFANFKNNLSKHCTGDYIFQIDADELPSVYMIDVLPEILTHNDVDVFKVPRINTVQGITQQHIDTWKWGVNDKGWINFPDYQWRLYRNNDKVKWKNRVHEVLDGYQTMAYLPAEEQWCLRHDKTIEKQEQQNSKYNELELKSVKVVGITRIRNEENIIQHTLDHVSKLVDEIYVYDDCSTDNTVAICESHPKVTKVIKGTYWDSEPSKRINAEGSLRQLVYESCLQSNPDWVYYFDSDEFADFEGINLIDPNVHWYSLRLFDYYITKDDVDTHFLERKWMGPEFRDILMLFRPTPNIKFYGRSPSGVGPRGRHAGYVKHYGKATTVEDWENACDYYINHLTDHNTLIKTDDGKMVHKWEYRKGKAIHDKSDFGYELIQWEQRKDPNVVIDNSQGQIEK